MYFEKEEFEVKFFYDALLKFVLVTLLMYHNNYYISVLFLSSSFSKLVSSNRFKTNRWMLELHK